MFCFSKILKTFLCLALLFCLTPASARAQGLDMAGFYVAPKAVYSYQQLKAVYSYKYKQHKVENDKYKSGAWGGGLALGYDFFPPCDIPIRVELEYLYRGNNTVKDASVIINRALVRGKVKMSASTVLANAYYDFHNQTPFTPYLGAGLGWGRAKAGYSIKIPSFNIDHLMEKASNNFVWNVGAGLSYALNENISFDLGYRYSDFGKVKMTSDLRKIPPVKLNARATANEVLFAVRYTF